MKLQIALVVLLGLATSMSAQTDVPRTGETLRGGAEALKKFESRISLKRLRTAGEPSTTLACVSTSIFQ